MPNFVTSNCFIAQAYARSIASFLRDHLGRRERFPYYCILRLVSAAVGVVGLGLSLTRASSAFAFGARVFFPADARAWAA